MGLAGRLRFDVLFFFFLTYFRSRGWGGTLALVRVSEKKTKENVHTLLYMFVVVVENAAEL